MFTERAGQRLTHLNNQLLITFVSERYRRLGLDHGTWAVLRHMYPLANVPVVQMSLDLSQGPNYHLNIGRQLSSLRDKGVLIIGSGILVHNLRQIRWDADAQPFDWAIEFDE